MGATFARIKTWTSTEDVTASDLNAEFNNILTNLTPSGVDDYSTNTSQMQTQTDPGEVGTESLATSLAGELARLRFALKEITGEDYWYESPTTSLLGLSNAIGSGLQTNRLVSGRKRSDVSASLSAQPVFLVPNGAARTVKLDGTPVNFIYYVSGVQYTISSDVTLTNLTAAPSSNNTCLVNDTIAADQDWTKFTGENGTEIPVDNMGSEISALVGKWAAFSLAGTTTEYFIAYVASTTSLTKVRRGYFFDSSDNPVPRAGYSNNDTITLLKLSWIYAKTDLTLEAAYTNPTYGKDEPTSPATGDFHFDTDSQTWKKYNGTSFAASGSTLVGVCVQDTSNTIGARSFEFFLNYEDENTFELLRESNTQVKTLGPAEANVWGNAVKNEHNLFTWDMTLDLDSGIVEGSSTYYYFYLTEEGDKVISDIRPYDRRNDLGGYYHPHSSWRAIGWAFNDGSSNLSEVESYFKSHGSKIIMPAQTAAFRVEATERIHRLDTSGGAFTTYLPPAALTRGSVLTFYKTTSDFSLATLSTVNSENIIFGGTSAATTTVATQGETVELYSNGTAYIGKRYIPGDWTSYTPTGANFGTLANVAFWWKRQGDSILIRGVFDTGTTVGATAGIELPGSLTIDSAKIPGDQRPLLGLLVGSVGATGTGVPSTAKGPWPITYDSADATKLVFSDTVDTDSGVFTLLTGTNIGNATRNTLSTHAIPVTGWNG